MLENSGGQNQGDAKIDALNTTPARASHHAASPRAEKVRSIASSCAGKGPECPKMFGEAVMPITNMTKAGSPAAQGTVSVSTALRDTPGPALNAQNDFDDRIRARLPRR